MTREFNDFVMVEIGYQINRSDLFEEEIMSRYFSNHEIPAIKIVENSDKEIVAEMEIEHITFVFVMRHGAFSIYLKIKKDSYWVPYDEFLIYNTNLGLKDMAILESEMLKLM